MLMTAVFTIGSSAGFAAEPVRLAYVEWSSSVAGANLVKALIQEKLGLDCRLMEMRADRMWEAVATGKADAMVSAWLPDTHALYYEKYKDDVVDLGPNLKGTRIGLVVPEITTGRLTAGTGIRNRPYMDIDSIPEMKAHTDKFKNRIIGIDPEAGIMHKTLEAMEAYDLNSFRLIEGSEVSMVAELTHSIQRQRWIVVTGWLPHWIFARWELKFLEDPENVYGSWGSIHTIVRKGLQEEMPEVCRMLDLFYWSPEDMGQVMLWNQQDKGLYPYEKALRWINTHPKRVEIWLEK